MLRLTAEQRYRQAQVKARIINQRKMRDWMADKTPFLEGAMVAEKQAIIDELDRLITALQAQEAS